MSAELTGLPSELAAWPAWTPGEAQLAELEAQLRREMAAPAASELVQVQLAGTNREPVGHEMAAD